MTQRFRVGLTGLQHELNSFVPGRTTLETFLRWRLLDGQQVLGRGGRDEVAGAESYAGQHGIDLLPGLLAVGGAGPVLDDETYHELRRRTLEAVARMAGQVDGLYLPLHGAMASVSVDDTEADLLSAIRSVAGDMLIVASFDMHAHLTDAMAQHLDGIVVFRTCPHTDYEETGQRAMQLLHRALSGSTRPVVAHRKLRLITPAEVHDTTSGPMMQVEQMARELEQVPGILSVSVAATQPWMDVPQLGWSVAVVADGDRELAQQAAERLAQSVWEMRADFTVDRMELANALDILCSSATDQRPFVLVDAADAPSAGSYGDSSYVLAGLLERGASLPGPVLLTITDPAAAAACHGAGQGARVRLPVGGAVQPGFFSPVEVTGTVVRAEDKPFQLMLPPALVWPGRSAVLSVDERIMLLITEKKVSTLDQQPYLEMGLNPAMAKAVLVKSAGNFHHHYDPIAYRILDIDTPGPVNGDLPSLPFRRITRPLWPFDPGLTTPFGPAGPCTGALPGPATAGFRKDQTDG
jgi:microcystin degradation protein MlrC